MCVYLEKRLLVVLLCVCDAVTVLQTDKQKSHKVVKLKDDLMAATQYAEMMIRYARAPESNWQAAPVDIDYDPLRPSRRSAGRESAPLRGLASDHRYLH